MPPIWVVRAVFSDENSICGSYETHTYGGIPYIMGHASSIIPEKVLIYEPSGNPILEKVLLWSLLSLIWSLLGLIWVLGPIELYLGPIELYLVPIGPYLALLALI